MPKLDSILVRLKTDGEFLAYVYMREILKLIAEEGKRPWGTVSVEAELARQALIEIERLERKV